MMMTEDSPRPLSSVHPAQEALYWRGLLLPGAPMLVRTYFLALAAFTLLALYLLLVCFVLFPFIAPLAWAAIIAIATFPLFRRLRARLYGRGNLASALMTPLVVILLTIPFFAVLFFLLAEIDGLLDQIQVRLATGDLPTMAGLGEFPGVAPLLEFLQPILEDFNIDLRETAAPALQNLISAILEKSKDLATISLRLVIGTFIMFTALFFFYRDGERLMDLFWSILPLPPEQKVLLGQKIESVLSAVLYGIFLTALIQGILGFIGYLLADLPSPVLLGALTVLAALVPTFGTALVWLPGALYLLFSGDIFPGLFLLVWGAVVVASTDNFIRPYFISGRGGLPFLTVLLGVLGGLAAFGFVGIVLGPIVLALFFTVLGIFRELLPAGIATPEGNPAEPDGEG